MGLRLRGEVVPIALLALPAPSTADAELGSLLRWKMLE